MNTLFARLSLALLAIVLVISGALFAVNLFSARNYYEEITQRLNESIAMYVTEQSQLIADGEVDRQALATLAEQAMVINPTVEVYLLDTQGRILGHGDPDNLLTTQVNLAPVRQLLTGNTRLPLRGTDPRSNREKIFSTWPVMQGDTLQGYLYAVLGGQKYDALASSIRGSYVQQVSLAAVLVISLSAFLVGLLVFNLMTRRLGRLTRRVRQFTESGFDPDRSGFLPPAGPAPKPSHQPVADRGDTAFFAPANVTVGPGQTGGRGLADNALPSHRGDEITQLHTAFRHMADKIVQQVEELKETDRLRRELISNVSHDLRTPLSSLHGYIETLLIKNRELDAEQRRQYLEVARKHSRRLERLISDLFELSKLEAAAIKPRLEQFSLAELLQDVTREFMLEAGKKQIELKVEGDPDNALVRADISLVQRVLENLLRNAIRHTPRRGTVTVSIDPRPEKVAVTVADTGCGIAEKDLDRVFERFYRSEQDDPLANDSAGLGLAIVQKILDLHGSRIAVTSKLNNGTTFAFDLPSPRAA